MIEQIEIHKDGYRDFELTDLTSNTIILFSSPQLKNEVLKEVEPIWNYREKEDNDSVIYIMESDNEPEPYLDLSVINIRYLPTTIINLQGGQKFVFTVEAPFILQARRPNDIWFVDKNKNDEIECWAFSAFRGYKEVWKKGINSVYSEFCQGRYGCYQGYQK